MDVTINEVDGKTVVNLQGRLDTINAQEFEKKLTPLVEVDAPNIVFECNDFDYISSSGLRVFLSVQKNVMARKGSLVIRGMKQDIKDVFDMTGFSSIFTIE